MSNHALAVRAILQLEGQLLVRRAVFLLFAPIPDIAFALEHLGEAALHFRERHFDTGALDPHSIADAREHIGDGVSHHVVLDSGSLLPTCVADAGDQSLVGQFAETNATNAKLAIHGPWAAAQSAAALLPRAELGRFLRFGDLGFACHRVGPLLAVSY